MTPQDKDLGYVWDIYDACGEIAEFLAGVTYTDYERNKMLHSAVERKLEIVGEAAKHIRREFQERYPHAAWSKAIGLRNILIHEYGGIRHEVIYGIATHHVPALLQQMKQILAEHNVLHKEE